MPLYTTAHDNSTCKATTILFLFNSIVYPAIANVTNIFIISSMLISFLKTRKAHVSVPTPTVFYIHAVTQTVFPITCTYYFLCPYSPFFFFLTFKILFLPCAVPYIDTTCVVIHRTLSTVPSI